MAALCLLPMVWAGDTPFVADEPQLIRKALTANAVGEWERVGLQGTVGIFYGPLPTWLYQAALSLTTDVVSLVRLRAVLVMAATLGGVAWIARLVGFGGPWLLGIALSPYLLFYARVLWDNSFNIPLAALAVALTLHVLIRNVLWPLPVLVAIAGAMLLVHLMSVSLIAAVVVVLLVAGRRVVLAAPARDIACVLAACVGVIFVEWRLSADYLAHMFVPAGQAVAKSGQPDGWWFAVLSPRLLSAIWIDYFFPIGYLEAGTGFRVFDVARWVTGINFLLAWLGCVLTVVGLFVRRDAVTLAGLLGLTTLVTQTAVNAHTHTFGHPHYYNATWIAPALLIGVALAWLERWRRRLSLAVGATVAASLAVASVFIAVRLHTTGGARPDPRSPFVRNFGPTIGNQNAVVQAIRPFGLNTVRRINVGVFPTSLETLYQLNSTGSERPAPPPTPGPGGLEIRYEHPSDPWDGRIGVYPVTE